MRMNEGKKPLLNFLEQKCIRKQQHREKKRERENARRKREKERKKNEWTTKRTKNSDRMKKGRTVVKLIALTDKETTKIMILIAFC